MIRVLNLYAGIGGNRILWPSDEIEVTAVEISPEIAAIYQAKFPMDKVIIADAHQYLLEHFEEFNFIWSSPPCPTHSRIRFMATKSDCVAHPSFSIKYAEMSLYQEIILLTHYFKGKWVVENVIGYYEPLIKPYKVGSHYYWSNFVIPDKDDGGRNHFGTIAEKYEKTGFDLSDISFKDNRKYQVLRNCVEPKMALYIFRCAFKDIQVTLV